jgi:hypothetical protein
MTPWTRTGCNGVIYHNAEQSMIPTSPTIRVSSMRRPNWPMMVKRRDGAIRSRLSRKAVGPSVMNKGKACGYARLRSADTGRQVSRGSKTNILDATGEMTSSGRSRERGGFTYPAVRGRCRQSSQQRPRSSRQYHRQSASTLFSRAEPSPKENLSDEMRENLQELRLKSMEDVYANG